MDQLEDDRLEVARWKAEKEKSDREAIAAYLASDEYTGPYNDAFLGQYDSGIQQTGRAGAALKVFTKNQLAQVLSSVPTDLEV